MRCVLLGPGFLIILYISVIKLYCIISYLSWKLLVSLFYNFISIQRNVSVVIRRAFSQTNIIIINYLDIGAIGFK